MCIEHFDNHMPIQVLHCSIYEALKGHLWIQPTQCLFKTVHYNKGKTGDKQDKLIRFIYATQAEVHYTLVYATYALSSCKLVLLSLGQQPISFQIPLGNSNILGTDSLMLTSISLILPVAEQECLAILWVCIVSGFCPQKVPLVPT